MQIQKSAMLLLPLSLSLFFGACGAVPQNPVPASSTDKGLPSNASSSVESGLPSQVEKVLYIGMGDVWAEVPRAFSSEPTPIQLIQAISEETEWNLTLAEPAAVVPGEEGASAWLTVAFSKESALWIGPPEPQNEKYFVFDSEDLVFHILDSVQKTLQENLPALDGKGLLMPEIYFRGEDGQPLSLPGLEIEIPADSPYPGSKALTQG